MTGPESPTAELSGTAGYLARWRPSSVSPQAASFARQVVAAAGPHRRERAKNLLWAAGRLADWAIGLGLEPVPELLLHQSVIGPPRVFRTAELVLCHAASCRFRYSLWTSCGVR